MKNSDGELIDKAFYGDRAISALKVFRAIKHAGCPTEEDLCEKLKMTKDEITDMTDSLRRAGFITSGSGGHHQVSRSYKEGEL